MSLFGSDDVLEESTKKAGLDILDKLPMDPSSTKLVDSGNVEDLEADILANTVKAIEDLL